jgi:hypothetical protein
MVMPHTLPKFDGLCIRRKQTNELLITSLFLLSYKKCPECPPCLLTQTSALSEEPTQTFEDSGCILYFACKLTSVLQYPSSIDCNCTEYGFQMTPYKISN